MYQKTKFLSHAAIIAALYVILTFLASAFGLSGGVIQLRLSEALTILPVFTPAAIPGLFIGCLLSNIFTGYVLWDIVFGSLATLIGAVGTHYFKKNKYIATLPPILANTSIVPFVLRFAYGTPGALWYFAITVGIGEILSCGVLGLFLHSVLRKCKHIF